MFLWQVVIEIFCHFTYSHTKVWAEANGFLIPTIFNARMSNTCS
jgi:hypothetical protein